MRLRAKPTFIRTGAQEAPVKKRANIDKYVYIGLLIIVVILVFWRLSRVIFYATGYGQILISKLEVQPINDVRILKIYVREGQEVKQGDVLYAYAEGEGTVGPGYDYQARRDREALLRQITKVSGDKNLLAKTGSLTIPALLEELDGKNQEKAYYEKLLKQKQADLERMQKMVLLEAYLPYNTRMLEDEIEKIRYQIMKTETDISLLKLQVAVSKEKQKTELANLNNEENLMRSQLGLLWVQGGERIGHFKAPISGTVTRIYYEEKEVALKGQTIMDIYQLGEIRIKAFFEQKDVALLNINRTVTIEFPDGVKKKGVITNVYSATLPQPPEFQKRYEPVHRSVIADIMPLKYTIEPSRELYKMSVKVYVPKFSPGGRP
jgi:multidrug resistance efflux pump